LVLSFGWVEVGSVEKLLFQLVKAIIHFNLSKQQPGSSTSGIHVEKVCSVLYTYYGRDFSEIEN
jgi:hypothetical protein